MNSPNPPVLAPKLKPVVAAAGLLAPNRPPACCVLVVLPKLNPVELLAGAEPNAGLAPPPNSPPVVVVRTIDQSVMHYYKWNNDEDQKRILERLLDVAYLPQIILIAAQFSRKKHNF